MTKTMLTGIQAAQWLTDNSSDTLPGNPQMRPMYIQHEQSGWLLWNGLALTVACISLGVIWRHRWVYQDFVCMHG